MFGKRWPIDIFLTSLTQGKTTHVASSDTEYQSQHPITANMLILNAEALGLQSANRDGEGNDEVCEDHNRVRVTDGSESSPDLCLVS